MVAPTQAPLGRLALCGAVFTRGGTWGAEQSVATGHQVLATGISMQGTKPGQHFMTAAGLKFQQVELVTDAKGNFEIKGDLRYDGCFPMLMSYFYGLDVAAVVDVTAASHTPTWDDYNTAVGSIALWFNNTNGTLQVLNSCKISSVTLEAKSNAPVHVTVKGVGDQLLISPAHTTTNTTAILTTLAGATGNDAIKQAAMYWHARTYGSQNAGFIRLRKVTGAEGNCSSADDVLCSSWKLSMDRKMKQPDSQSKLMGEPYEDGQPSFTCELDIPGFEGNPSDTSGVVYQLVQDLDASLLGTPAEYKGDFYFESPTVAGNTTTKYSLRFRLPSLALKIDNPGVSNMGMAPVKIHATAMKAAAAPNGSDWAGLVNPVNYVLINKRATIY